MLKRAPALDFAGLFSSPPMAQIQRFNIGSERSVRHRHGRLSRAGFSAIL